MSGKDTGTGSPPKGKPTKCICGRTNPGGCEVRGCYWPHPPPYTVSGKDTARRSSELAGVIGKLQRGERLSAEAIAELDRLLGLLRDEGWSGFIPADEALAAVLR